MPLQSNLTDVRLTDLKTRLTSVVALLNDLHDACGTPFVLSISNSTLALITAVQVTWFDLEYHHFYAVLQGVKRNREECIQLMEDIQSVLYAIIIHHMKSEPKGSLPPAMLHDLGNLAQ